MRIECQACDETSEARLVRATTSSATFACAGCGTETTSKIGDIRPAPTSSDNESSDNESGEPCPKCSRPVASDAASCPSCGLTREKFLGFASAGPAAAPELVSAWKRAEESWGKSSVHEDFVAEISLSGNYRAGALWYRQASTDPVRAGKALEMLDRVQAMATAALMSAKPKLEVEKEPYKNVLILLMVMLFLGAGVGFILMSGNDAKPAPENTPEYEPSFARPKKPGASGPAIRTPATPGVAKPKPGAN